MILGIETVAILFLGAFTCELVDSSMGMLYGTLLSPALLLVGLDPLLVVPSILFSQSIGGLTASTFHHRFKNVEFRLISKDSLTVYAVTAGGILVTTLAVVTAIQIPKVAVKSYIGILVLGIGVLLLSRRSFRFSWKKVGVLGMISSFNKGLTGGGFGPVLTGGQIIAGRESKRAVGVTTMAEAPICITGFLAYALINGISDWRVPLILSCGAVLAAPLGAYATFRFHRERLKTVLGLLVVGLGAWTLFKVWAF